MRSSKPRRVWSEDGSLYQERVKKDMKELKDLSKITQYARNTYEAVIMASKRARILNRKRLKEIETSAEPSPPGGGMHRVAEAALEELLQGKIEIRRD